MSTLLDFVEAHPLLTIILIVVVGGQLADIINAVGRALQ